MGTSASNGGPKGSPPLLPPWYNEGTPQLPPTPEPPGPEPAPPEPVPPPNPPEREPLPPPQNEPNFPLPLPEVPANELLSKNWQVARGALTRMSNNTGGSSARKAGQKYVSSLGGSRSATRAAAQGVSTGSRYASFLGSVASSGFEETLISLGLAELIGKSSEEICTALANSLAPVGATNDEAIARDAMISTLDVLYTKIQENGGDITDLDNLSPELIKETLVEYVSNYIFAKWMYELGTSIEKGNISEQEAIDLETSVKDLIYAETIEQYRNVQIEVDTLGDISTSQKIEEIFSTAYSLLES